MLVCSFNLSQSFNLRALSLLQKTVQIRDQLFLYSDSIARKIAYYLTSSVRKFTR